MIASYEIDTVLTFDRGGVSGHANHTSIYNAMVFLSLENRLPQGSNPSKTDYFESLLGTIGLLNQSLYYMSNLWPFSYLYCFDGLLVLRKTISVYRHSY